MKCVYTVWLRDLCVSADDQDYEWPACFVVDGMDIASARRWADGIAERYAKRSGQQVLGSAIEALDTCTTPGVQDLPLVLEGDRDADARIGW